MQKEEEDFIRYWSEQRKRKTRFLTKLSIGLPLGVLVMGGILINLMSGWYEKADMVLRSNTSTVIVVLIAGVGIVAFITIFGARHKWDQNELHYKELLYKKEKEEESSGVAENKV